MSLADESPQAAQGLTPHAHANAKVTEAKARSAKAQNTAAVLGERKRVLLEEPSRVTPSLAARLTHF